MSSIYFFDIINEKGGANMTTRKTAAFTADAETIERIRAMAEAERRTLSQMILILIEEALNAREKGGK